jgi:hypothetical protein
MIPYRYTTPTQTFLLHYERAWLSFLRTATLSLLFLFAGCANGDFGRIRPALVNDDMHAWVGKEAPGRKNKPASNFPLTDAERQLRDLAFPLIEPPYDRQRWYSVIEEYGLTGAAETPYPDRSAYANQLLTTAVRSHTARYAKLVEDIRNDVIRVDPFFAVARYVLDMDRKRKESLKEFGASNNKEAREDARARIAENVAVINWVQKSLHARAASYQFALERLVVETPSPMAAEAERSVTLLQTRIAAHQGILNSAVAAGPAMPPGGLDPGFDK